MQFESHLGGGLTEAMMAGGGGGGAAAAEGGAAGAEGGMAAFSASLVALGPVLAVIAVAIAAVVAVGLAMAEQWKNVVTIFGETGGQTMAMLVEFGKALWSTLGPILKLIGSVLLIPLSSMWLVFTTLLRGLLFALTAVFDVLGWVTNAIYQEVKPAFDFIFELFKDLAAFINKVFGEASSALKSAKGPKATEAELSTEPNADYSRWLNNAPLSSSTMDLSKAPKGAVNITQDFRGSRIAIRQEFKGDADPDRIVMAQMDALTRQAENRISSGYAGALTR
jgi:hypothetical protein